MSQTLTVEHANKVFGAQVNVFQLLAELTATKSDDDVLRFLQDSEDARVWALEMLGLEHETQQLRINEAPLPFLGQAAKYGVTIVQVLAFLNKYWPQIMLVLNGLKELYAAFAKESGVTVTPGNPVRPVINE